MPGPPGDQTHQSTLPYGVDALTPGLPMLWPAAITVAGSSLVAARPGGYTDGAEDATTVPSAAIATTAVTAWWPWIGPVIAGTISVLPPGASRAWPGRGGWAAVAEYGSGRHAAGIALGELLAVALRGDANRGHQGLLPGAVHQLGCLVAEHERLDQHHDGERDENVGGDQPAHSPHALRRTRSSTPARYLRATLRRIPPTRDPRYPRRVMRPPPPAGTLAAMNPQSQCQPRGGTR